ncbi:MAG: phosphotransferase [Halieaceae bacterium]|jgi:aminoglycoside phosphotransferase (APT) family kinase protein|nr:phosphotransferase [Halieaceae bacterium]
MLAALVKTTPKVLFHTVGMGLYRPLDPSSLQQQALAELLDLPCDDLNNHRWECVNQGTTNRWRIELPEAAVSSLFVKSNPWDFSTRLFGAMFQLSINEMGFYRQIRPHLNIPSPRCHGLKGNAYRYLIVLEDLATRNACFSDISSRCDLQRAEFVIDTLAALHASCWQDARMGNDWKWINRQQYRRNNAFLTFLRQYACQAAVKRYRDLLPDETFQLAWQLNHSYPLLEQRWGQGERTLVHGDAHIGNMYFLPSGEAGLLDWQVLGYEHGMRDVSYFIINSLPTDVRRRHQQQLIERYVQRLERGGTVLDQQMALHQYRLHAAYAWVSAAVTAASNTLQERKIAAAGLIRASRALIDLDIGVFLEKDING